MNRVERVYRRLVLARVRHMIAGVTLIIGLSRLGLLSPGPLVTIPNEIYGAALLVITVALFLTAGRWRSRFLGRVVAGLAFCVLTGLACDFWWTLHASTTALILLWLAVWLFWETVAEHEC